MQLLRVPLINANDDEVEIVDVLVGEGGEVRAGERLFVIESTKATLDVEAPSSGFVRKVAVHKGQRVRVHALLAVITPTPTEQFELADDRSPTGGGVRATRKAEELAARHGLALESLGLTGIIREADVERVIRALAPRPARASRPLDVPEGGGVPVIVLGAGGHARVLVDLMCAGRAYFPVAALDDGDADSVLGVPVVGAASDLTRLRGEGFDHAALGIGSVQDHKRRRRYWDQLVAAGFALPNLVHLRATVEPSATMGTGNQVFAGAVIGSAVVLGDDTIINSGTVVSHDCVIGSHTHISPGALLAGGVQVGENTLIGMGVTIYLGVRIGSNVVIANGSHIMKDVSDGTIVRAPST